EALLEAGLVAEDGRVLVHRRAELGLDLADAATGALAADDLVDLRLLLVAVRPGQLAVGHRRRVLGGVLTGAPAEDQRVEQRVRAEAVAAVHRHAGALAGGVQAGDLGQAVGVGPDAAHRVVVARLDVDRLARDVDAGEVAAHQDDLAQRLVDALARHDRDVERDGAVGEAAALVDLGLLGA